MSDRDTRVFGQKYACPGCQSLLKFRRPPKSLLQTCPNCRRQLRLYDQAAAASEDEQLKQALDSLIDWNPPEPQKYDYNKDPLLDRVDTTDSDVWKFDQPWPENVHQMVFEHVEVSANPVKNAGFERPRMCLLDGYHRRVTIFRTGEVEEIAVQGYWWERENNTPQEIRVGLLSRSVVRELNLVPGTPVFAARINCFQRTISDSQEFLALFIDIAIDESPVQKLQQRRFR